MLTPKILKKFAANRAPKALAAPSESAPKGTTSGKGIAESPDTLAAYLAEHGVNVVRRKKRRGGSVVFLLDKCPINSEHGQRGDTAVVWRTTGIGFECKHNSCVDVSWSGVRRKIDPEWPPRSGKGVNQSTWLVELADDAELFHDHEDRAYATVTVCEHNETHAVGSKAFRRLLARRLYEEAGKAPHRQAMEDAVTVIEGKAVHEGPVQQVHVRVAAYQDAIYLDLANKEWEAVEITRKGWQTVRNPPVKFVRPPGMLPLVTPVPGGDIRHLKRFVNVANERDFVLLIAWLVGTFHPSNPYPILVLNGEKGTAKSTTERVLRALIDPSSAPLRSLPGSDRDLNIAAKNSWLLAFDNLGGIPAARSDALCRLATGGGFATRLLYENSEEALFDAKRPIIANGISEIGTKSDFLDRTIRITLPVISKKRRRQERTIWREFEKRAPRILGALLDAVSTALRRQDSVKLQEHPRMADFAVWVVAAEPSLPWRKGAFLAAYSENQEAANILALEASSVAPVLRRLIDEERHWTGTATELLELLDDYAGKRTVRRKGWPKAPNVLSRRLREVASNLRAVGIQVDFGERAGHNRERIISIRKVPQKIVRIVRKGKKKAKPSKVKKGQKRGEKGRK